MSIVCISRERICAGAGGWKGFKRFLENLFKNKIDDMAKNEGKVLDEADEIKLFREGIEGVEKASKKLIQNISKKRTVQIAEEGSDDLKYLEWMEAEANVGGEDLTHILLKPNPSKAAILEEFLHDTQKKIKMIEKSSDIAYAEYHVKDFMIRHKKILGLGEEDIEILKNLRDRDFKIWKKI